MPFASINPTNPRTNSWKKNFKKKWKLAELENELFFSWPFWFFFQKKFLFCFFLMKQPWLSYEVSFFLHYVWFLQNLGKDFIRTNMHTTVASSFLGSVIIKYVQVRRATTILERREGALSWCACWTPGSILSIQGRRRSFILFNRSCIMIMTQGTSWNEF